ncbi:MAG: murein biosynthesis integral membrane protein MurJ [Endomicrobium sp.]|jgi:putative peptidoglycan lipid II flippase|nr:murein biosynthesis integral membrane protein MurJ [Endomicrobium sp.]
MKNKVLIEQVGETACGTVLSRILGYIRDMLVANIFGTSMYADAFYVAFRIPNLFRRMFGEGSFSAAFVPVFSEYLHTRGRSETQKFLNSVFTILLILLLIINILCMIFSPFLIKLAAGGFLNEPEKMQLTIKLTRLIFPSMIFMCLSAFLLAVLNVLHSFFLPALAPSTLNLSEIFYILVFCPLLFPEDQIKGLSISVIIGGVFYFFVQYIEFKKLKWRLNFYINFKHPGVKKIIFLMIPSIIGLSVDQINALVDSRCASSMEHGAVSVLYYSNRLMQMPLAVFGFAIVTAILPSMSKSYAKKDLTTFNNFLNYSIRLTIFSILPSMTGLIVIGLPIIKILFERGEFNSLSAIMTNKVLIYYSLGLPAYALTKIFANAFYSLQNTKTPVKIAVTVMILHAILCIVLMQYMGVSGLAFATSISSYVNLILLILCFEKRIYKIDFRQIMISFLKSSLASIVTGIIAFNMCKTFNNLFIAVPVAILCGIMAFITVSYILKSEELKVFIHIFLNK